MRLEDGTIVQNKSFFKTITEDDFRHPEKYLGSDIGGYGTRVILVNCTPAIYNSEYATIYVGGVEGAKCPFCGSDKIAVRTEIHTKTPMLDEFSLVCEDCWNGTFPCGDPKEIMIKCQGEEYFKKDSGKIEIAPTDGRHPFVFWKDGHYGLCEIYTGTKEIDELIGGKIRCNDCHKIFPSEELYDEEGEYKKANEDGCPRCPYCDSIELADKMMLEHKMEHPEEDITGGLWHC